MIWNSIVVVCLQVLALKLADGLKISNTAHQIVHNTYSGYPTRTNGPPLNFDLFGVNNIGSQSAPIPLTQSNPLVSFARALGSHFPRAGQATCATPPAACEQTTYRTLDGSCNHLENPGLGIANSRYGRLLTPRYGDGISSPTLSITGDELPNARQISLTVFGEADVPDPNFTLMNMQWGQIVTHDMSMTAGGTQSRKHPTRCCTDDGRLVGTDTAHKTCFAIIIPPHDPAYSQVGTECLNFVRTLTDLIPETNCTDAQGVAEQLTVVTAYMDLSHVYGNSMQQNSEIRAFNGGRMIVEERNGAAWLPSSQNVTGDCDTTDVNEICYRAGDIRVNQNPGLAILHTILLREHNRLADALAALNPHYDDRTLFQEARKINIAQFQRMTYYEWLPILLGRENMERNRLIYQSPPLGTFINDYDANIDPSVLNEHATAAFRYFHSAIEGRLDLLSELRSVLDSLRLSDWLNRPGIIEAGDNFDALTRGHSTQPEELNDINIDREIKHFLFRRNMPFGSDLRAIDIQRNRDHGLASYNDVREFCGLPRASRWEDYEDLIDPQVNARLRSLYASHEDVDLTVGAAVEAHVSGALAGPTFLCILTEQFFRTRVGDRFFFENGDNLTGFTSAQLTELRKSSLSRLLCDNGNNIASMQPNAFISISKSNRVVPCSQIPQVDLTQWIDQRPQYRHDL